jgi:hypothetical protein
VHLWLKTGHKLYEADPYDKRLVKALMIKFLRTENTQAYSRCEDDKRAFIGYTSIKSWMGGCYLNCKKFDACAQYSLSDGFKQEEKEAKKVLRARTPSVDIQTRSGRVTQVPAKYGS